MPEVRGYHASANTCGPVPLLPTSRRWAVDAVSYLRRLEDDPFVNDLREGRSRRSFFLTSDPLGQLPMGSGAQNRLSL